MGRALILSLTILSFSLGEIAAGGNLKEAGSHWLDPNRDATDQYDFTALPAGYRASYENRYWLIN